MMLSRRLITLVLLLQTFGLLSQTSAASSSTSPTAIPSPLVVPPSQNWDGNDGSWSSFFLRVGTPAQTVSVQISTAGNQPLVVLPEGCSSADPSTCSNDRGGLFQTNKSSTWVQNNITENGIFGLAIETNLGYNVNALYGYDTVTLSYPGSGTPTMADQVLGGIAAKDIYMGLFGLNPASSNFTNYNNPVPSYMWNLKNQSQIPSLSYGYTAGAPYRFNKVLGSLTLGGYDASLFEPNDLTIGFDSNSDADLTVNIQSITYTANNINKTLSSTTIPAFIDSTFPYLWLPLDVCARFEEAFNITYDNTTSLYLINDTLHTQLLSQNPSITFTLTNVSSMHTVDITLPYSTFDLTASYPLIQSSDTTTNTNANTNTSKYFPLKRAKDTSQITLGRTFLQEAYLIADYERYNFSISQRKWDADAQQDIRTILPASNDNSSSNNHKNNKKKTPIAAIVGASVGGLVLITLIIGTILLRRKNHRLRREKAAAEEKVSNHRVGYDSLKSPYDNNMTSPAISMFKPELDAQGTSRMSRMGGVDGMNEHHHHHQELDVGQERRMVSELESLRMEEVHEMPAREVVGSELSASAISAISASVIEEEGSGRLRTK